MAYYFMSEVSKGKHIELNLSKSKYFQVINKRYKTETAYTLEEIDKFTMMFTDEIELRERLVEEGVLPLSLFEKPLSIRYNKQSKVPYDFLYQKDIEYIMEPSRLVEKIIKRFYDKDFLLIKKIINRFDGDFKCKSTLPEVRQHLEASIRDGEINKHFYDLDENNDKLLSRLLKLIIIESFNTKSGKTIYQNKLRYRNLHILIALINYYDKEDKIIEEPIFNSVDKDLENDTPPTFAEVNQKNELTREYQFVKTRTLGKKKHILEKQTSFDI